MALSLVTAPTTEPLTVAEVRKHLRLDESDGEPAPTAPTAALISTAGNVTAGAHRYLCTFITADGETEGGAISGVVTTTAGAGQVSLSGIPLGGSAVTARKLYRTAANGSTYLLLDTIANNTASTYVDNIADGSLGAQAPTTNTTADPELVALITSAREFCENFTHRAFITQTWDLLLDAFPCDTIELPKAPLASVTSISYVDTAGATQTWADTLYDVDAPSGDRARPGRVQPSYAEIYPVTRAQMNAVTVRFVAGYGAASDVPGGLKHAMKLLIAHWWSNRDAVGLAMDEVPMGVASILWGFKAF